jgi:4-amino-4-deoxy-L-arabinose transferase-like glycosyltransferase
MTDLANATDDAASDVSVESSATSDGSEAERRTDAERSFRRWLLLIALVSLVWRVVYVLVWRADVRIWGDAYFYHESAKLIADGQGFVNPITPSEQAADHPPLYLVFLAGLTKLGLTSALSHILSTVVVGTASVYAAGLAGRELAGRRTGLIAAVLFAVYAGIWSWDGMLLSETFAILFVTVLVLLVYRYWRAPSLWRAVGIGAVLGLCTFSRAELLLLSLLVVTPLILATRTRPWKVRIGWLLASGATCGLVLAPWVGFNLSRFDQTVTLSAGGEITFATATCDSTYYGPFTGYWSMMCPVEFLEKNGYEAPTEIQEGTELRQDGGSGSAGGDQSVRSEIYTRESLSYLREHIDRLPVVVLARWGRITGTWNPIQQAQLDSFPEGRNQWISYLALAQWYPLVVLAVVGGIALRRRGIPVYPLVGPLVTVLVVVTIMFATNRYRAYAEAAIALLAAVGIDAGVRLYRRLRDDPTDRIMDPAAPTTAS